METLNTKRDDENKKSLNELLVLFLVIVICRHVIAIVANVMKIIGNGKYEFQGHTIELFDNNMLLYNSIVSFVMILILVLILCKKRYAVISFYVLQILNAIFITAFNNDFWVNLFVALVMCAVMTGLLFIRSNGRSAWNVIFDLSESDSVDDIENIDYKNYRP